MGPICAQMPGDPLFQRGFRLHGPREADAVRVLDANGKDDPNAKPLWSIAPWNSKGKLDRCERDENSVKFYDDYKSLRIDRKTGAFQMRLSGSEEYAGNLTREPKNPWVHLLLTQEAGLKTPMLHTLEKLVLELEFELLEFRSVLEYPPPHHAAQFQLFLYLRGMDREKPGSYKNFTWFGVSLFDCREDFTDDYAARDFAMPEGEFIYTIGSKHTLKEKVLPGRKLKIELDLLPHVKKALQSAHERGFMKGTQFEDTLFEGMNIGWEVPGNFDCGMNVHKFSLTPIPRKTL